MPAACASTTSSPATARLKFGRANAVHPRSRDFRHRRRRRTRRARLPARTIAWRPCNAITSAAPAVICRTGRETLCPNRKFTGDWGLVGGYAEYVAIEDDNVALVPDGRCAAGRIDRGLRNRHHPQRDPRGRAAGGPEKRALVTGAGGGLGMHAVQLARSRGRVTSSRRRRLRRRPIRFGALGAHEVIVHERGEDFSARGQEGDGGQGVDVAIDNVGSQLFDPIRRSMGIGGRWIMIGQLTGAVRAVQSGAALSQERLDAECDQHDAQAARRLPRAGRARRGQADHFAGAAARASGAGACSLLEAGKAAGRIVLRPNG